MDTVLTLATMEVLDFLACALVLILIFKNDRLRYRVQNGLNIALSYLGNYFRPVVNQTVNVPEPDARAEMTRAVLAGVLSNPRERYADNAALKARVEEIVESLMPQPEPEPEHEEEFEEEEFEEEEFEEEDEERDGEPNYERDNSEEEEPGTGGIF